MTIRPARLATELCLFTALTFGNGCDCNDYETPVDQVVSRAKPGIDFTQYHTFLIEDELTYQDLADAGYNPDNIPGTVRLNIDVANDQARIELERIGLTEAAKGAPADLSIVSLASTRDQDAIYWECVPGNWWGYWGWYWDTCAWLQPIYVEYTTGTVAVGLADPKEEDVVFGGVMRGIADGTANVDKRIRDGVHVIFEQYPVTPSMRGDAGAHPNLDAAVPELKP
jgi:hypothetical protein